MSGQSFNLGADVQAREQAPAQAPGFATSDFDAVVERADASHVDGEAWVDSLSRAAGSERAVIVDGDGRLVDVLHRSEGGAFL